MTKTSGLGDALYVGGYNLSGDIGSLGKIGGGPAALDITGIDKSATERIGGKRDGAIEFSAWHNPSASRAHPRLSLLPTTDTTATYCRGTTLGNPAAAQVSKQINYDGSRDADGNLPLAVQALANTYGLEWGLQLTAGTRTDAAATAGTGVDYSNYQTPCLYLPGAAGAYASTPDAASLDIVGDIDIRVRAAATDWTPAAVQILVAKWTTAGDQRSWAFGINTDGTLLLQWSTDGTAGTVESESSSAATAGVNGYELWMRVTLDVNNGAAESDIVFYTSTDGVTWTQLGTTQHSGEVTSIYSSTAVLEVGSRAAGTADQYAGKILEASVRAPIGGTVVAHPIATIAAFADATPLTWTINGTGYLTSSTPYGLQAYLQKLAFTGTDVTVKLQHSLDNGSTDAWADITGGGFTQITTTTPGTERIATAATAIIKRYIRATTVTGTAFSNLQFQVMAASNQTTVVF